MDPTQGHSDQISMLESCQRRELSLDLLGLKFSSKRHAQLGFKVKGVLKHASLLQKGVLKP